MVQGCLFAYVISCVWSCPSLPNLSELSLIPWECVNIHLCVCMCDCRFAKGLDELQECSQGGLWGVEWGTKVASAFPALISLMLQPSEFHCIVPKWIFPLHLIPGYCQAYSSLYMRASSPIVKLTKVTILHIFFQQFYIAVEAFWLIRSDLELILMHLEYLCVGIWEI